MLHIAKELGINPFYDVFCSQQKSRLFALYLESSSVVQRKCNVKKMLLVLLIGLLLPARGSFVGPWRRWNIICLRWKCLSKIKYRTPFNNEMLNRCQNGQMCSCNSILDGNIWPYGQNQRKLFLISNDVIGGHMFLTNRKENVYIAWASVDACLFLLHQNVKIAVLQCPSVFLIPSKTFLPFI